MSPIDPMGHHAMASLPIYCICVGNRPEAEFDHTKNQGDSALTISVAMVVTKMHQTDW